MVLAHSYTAAIDDDGTVTQAMDYPLATDSPHAPERLRSYPVRQQRPVRDQRPAGSAAVRVNNDGILRACDEYGVTRTASCGRSPRSAATITRTGSWLRARSCAGRSTSPRTGCTSGGTTRTGPITCPRRCGTGARSWIRSGRTSCGTRPPGLLPSTSGGTRRHPAGADLRCGQAGMLPGPGPVDAGPGRQQGLPAGVRSERRGPADYAGQPGRFCGRGGGWPEGQVTEVAGGNLGQAGATTVTTAARPSRGKRAGTGRERVCSACSARATWVTTAPLEAVLGYLRAAHPQLMLDALCSGPAVVAARYAIRPARLRWYDPNAARGRRPGGLGRRCLELARGTTVDTFRIAGLGPPPRRRDRARDGRARADCAAAALADALPMFVLSVSGKLLGTKVALVSVGTNVIGTTR